jgi:hypothetical protein
MAYFMTDVAAGSQAALQLQKNMAAVPYVGQEAAAAAEETQLKLQQDRLKAQYAPEAFARQAEEDRMRLEKMRLQKTIDEAQYVADTDSTKKLQQWMQSDDGKKATDSDIIKKAAALKFESGRVEEGTKLMTQAEKLDATAIANEAKTLAANNESIGKAFAAIDAVPDDQVGEYFNRLPEATKKLITNQTGLENWNKYSGAEKKQVVSKLMLNGKGLLAEQIKAVELKKTEVLTANRIAVEVLKQDGATARKEMEGDVKLTISEAANKAALERVETKAAADLQRVKQQGEDALARQKQKDADAMDRLKEQDASKERLRAEEDASKERIRKLEDASRERIKKMGDDTLKAIADAKLDAKDKPKPADDKKDVSFYYKEHDRIVKDGKEEEKLLTAAVNKADAARQTAKTASWYEFDAYRQDKYNTAYTDAVAKRNAFRKEQTKKELDVLKDMPESPTNKKIIDRLQAQMKLFEDSPQEDKKKDKTVDKAPAAAAAPVAAASAAGKVGAVPSNKSAAPKFEEGKIYTDAKGNRAKYVNGKWEPQ